MESGAVETARDGWSSRPMTVWIMDFNTRGHSLQEGEDRIFVAGLTDHMLQNSRAQLVERSLLDTLLKELKLGTSNLADRNTALALGKILAARLILSGQIIYAGPQTHVSMRLIETETGRITASVSETIGSAAPISVLSDRLGDVLSNKLSKLYPLRAKIMEHKGPEVRINIGQTTGVEIGQRFKTMDEKATLEVVEVQKDKSLTRLIEGDSDLDEGTRLVAY